MLIYLIGILLLGYFQYSVRSLLGDLLSFVAIIGYLILLRLLGIAAVRAVEWRESVIIARHNAAVVAKKEARVQSRLSKTNET
jgi:hypothetical protein